MSKNMLVDGVDLEKIRMVIMENGVVEEFEYESNKSIKGNIYLGTIVKVESSLQAAFVNFCDNSPAGFISFNDIHPKYYQIPESDKSQLMEKNEDNISFNSSLLKNYRIQDVLKRGQVILVQCIKDSRGEKGAALSSYITLAGKYTVLTPNAYRSVGGISKKIENVKERDRLKNILSNIEDVSKQNVILRTSAEGQSHDDIVRDIRYLEHVWSDIREKTLSSEAPTFIYQRDNLAHRIVSDLYHDSIDRVLIEGSKCFALMRSVAELLHPNLFERLELYKSRMPIFMKHRVEGQLAMLYSERAELMSGGYIIINQTEAMTVIDVNSGKSKNTRDVNATAMYVNLEACHEIARQLRLRDLSGLIAIDFIDMALNEHNVLVEKAMQDAVERDRSIIRLGKIGQFGIMEMSRQRINVSLDESNTMPCNYCAGRGRMRPIPAVADALFRAIMHEITINSCRGIMVSGSSDLITYIINSCRKQLTNLEKLAKSSISFTVDEKIGQDAFCIDMIESQVQKKRASAAPLSNVNIDSYLDHIKKIENNAPVVKTSRPKNTRQRRRKKSVNTDGDKGAGGTKEVKQRSSILRVLFNKLKG